MSLNEEETADSHVEGHSLNADSISSATVCSGFLALVEPLLSGSNGPLFLRIWALAMARQMTRLKRSTEL
ncbi:hypothetical protein GQ607_004567 [Colletotrichum asianum]|uniref:Uncharacterized protein n=1 Tax=Colletotrichum asianum TaxID=702518 RepID=A0A8H3ZUN4_9PEZI|nr:hypothetical protein GQ607_004567 [Colletotrichum asianum]